MNFPWLTDEEADELKRFQKHHDEDHQKSERQTKIRPGEEAHRAYPPSYAMSEPRRGLSLHSIHLLSFDVTLISRRDQSQARRC